MLLWKCCYLNVFCDFFLVFAWDSLRQTQFAILGCGITQKANRERPHSRPFTFSQKQTTYTSRTQDKVTYFACLCCHWTWLRYLWTCEQFVTNFSTFSLLAGPTNVVWFSTPCLTPGNKTSEVSPGNEWKGKLRESDILLSQLLFHILPYHVQLPNHLLYSMRHSHAKWYNESCDM